MPFAVCIRLVRMWADVHADLCPFLFAYVTKTGSHKI